MTGTVPSATVNLEYSGFLAGKHVDQGLKICCSISSSSYLISPHINANSASTEIQ